MADNVELPWPSAQGGMEWEWRVVSLGDVFPEEILASCVPDKDLGPEEELGGLLNGEEAPRLWQVLSRAEAVPCDGETSPGGDVVRHEERRGWLPVGARASKVPSWPLPLLRGARGVSGEEEVGGEETSSTSMRNSPPPFSYHLINPKTTHCNPQDECGGICFAQAEGGRASEGCGWGCPSGNFQPSRQWVGGFGIPAEVVGATPDPVLGVWSGGGQGPWPAGVFALLTAALSPLDSWV